MVSIPIRSRNSVIGVLSVNSARPRVFTEDESAALAICAEQAAIAIDNARLLEDSTRRQARLATILAINKRIAAHEDMASLLAQIAEEAERLIGADGAILRLLRGDFLVAGGQRRTARRPLMLQKCGWERGLLGGQHSRI